MIDKTPDKQFISKGHKNSLELQKGISEKICYFKRASK